MGLLTWIAIIVIILAVIGLGAGVFFSGVMRGADIVWNSPAVQNVTQEVEEFVQSTNLSQNSNAKALTFWVIAGN